MKLFLNLCGIGLAGLLGYSLEPNLRLQLTGKLPGESQMARSGKILLQLGDDRGQVDLETLTPEQLPAEVLISKPVSVADTASGITMNIPAGNMVKLVRIQGGNAVVSHGEANYIGTIRVMDTDLIKRLAENPPSMTVGAANPPPAPVPVPAPPTTGESAEPPAMPEPPPVPQPAPEPVASVEPAPMPEPATPEPAAPSAPVDVVQAMQESVKGGEIKEFKFDQVTEWTAGEPETVEGESFQTGTALYKAVTFLGEKSIEAKAFIKDGKVTRWIWPRSGMEIK